MNKDCPFRHPFSWNGSACNPFLSVLMATALLLVGGISSSAQEAPRTDDTQAEAPASDSEVPPLQQWLASQPELAKALEAVQKKALDEMKDTSKDEVTNAVIAIQVRLFDIAQKDKTKETWPVPQIRWALTAERRLAHEEKRARAEARLSLELALLEQLNASLQATAAKQGILEESSSSDSLKEDNESERVWRYRDPQGGRGTKPRYKGQEPVN